MTLATTDSRFVYDGDASTTAFSFPRKVIEASHLKVYLYDEDDDSFALQTINTHYTFAGTGLSNGIYASATITFLSAPGTDKKVVIFRDPTLTNEFDFTSETNVLNALNRFSDRVEMKLQRLDDRVDRSFRMADGDYKASLAELTALTGKAGYLPVVNDDEDGVEWVANNGSSTSVTPTGGDTARTMANWIADAVIMFATYAEMTAATYLVDNMIYGTYGRTAEEDGGFGYWRYDSASTATVDGGSIIAKDGGGAGRFFRLHDGIARPEWFGSSSAWGAAITAAAVNFNYVRFTPGVTYTWSDSQVVIDKSNFVLDCRGATIQPKYASDYAIKFGNGSTQRQNITVMGGTWNQRPASDGGPTQGLFDLRGVRAFYTINCFGVNIYQLARWGLPADSQNSYKWWNVGCEWNARINANGGHTDFIQADGSDGGFYNVGSTAEGDCANVSSAVAFMVFTSSQAPARFDHADFASGIVKGFDNLIKATDARVVNIEFANGFRVDDIGSYAFRVDVGSGASQGGCENIRLHSNFGGLGPGGICYISNAHASLNCEDITIDGAECNECAGPVCKFETTGSGTITAVHIDGLHIADYEPTDANQDAIIFSGDIDESSIDNVWLDGKTGATYLARRVVFDDTASTKKIFIGNNIYGDVNTAVVVRTNAGTTVGRHNLVRTDGTPVGAWFQATDRLLGRDTASAGPAEEISVGGGIEFTGSGGIQRSALTGDVTVSAGSNSTTIANDAVTYAKMQNVSAQYRVLGRSSSGAGDVEEVAASATGFTVLSSSVKGTWTPVLTFATAGDLSITYSEQVGTYVRIGNLVFATCNIGTSAFTHTSASGALQVTGLPLTSKNVASDNHIGGFVWGGITKASYTQIGALLVPNSTTVIFTASGSGVAATGVTAADMPTGGTVRLRFTLAYQV